MNSDEIIIKEYSIQEAKQYFGCIYTLISPIDKYYIGQTTDIRDRFYRYKRLDKKVKEQRKLYNALLKYGPENFIYKIIWVCKSIDEMNKIETNFIKIYNSVDDGYNLQFGGGNRTCSEETKKLLSEQRKGIPRSEEVKKKISASLTGRKVSDEIKRKQSIRMSGSMNPMFGKKFSQESKDKMRQAQLGERSHMWGKTLKEEVKSQIRDKINLRLKNKKWEWLYILKSPDNQVIYVKNLKYFCENSNYNLHYGHLFSVATGKEVHHKKWTANRVSLTDENRNLALDKHLFPN